MKFAREGSFCYNNFMKAVVQRVKSASVSIGGELFSSIENGLLVLLGVEKGIHQPKQNIFAISC